MKEALVSSNRAIAESPRDLRPRAIVVGAADTERAAIEAQIADLCAVAAAVPDPRAGLKAAREHEAELVLVVVDRDPDAAMAAAHALAGDGRAVVMVSRDRNPEHIVRAMRAGARDFAYLEQAGDLHRAVAALRARLAQQPARRGTVVAVFSAKGGSGATTVAANLARGLVASGRTVLVDVDLQMGDALVFLDLAASFGWRDLVRELPRLDDELLERSLVRHGSGLFVVAETGSVEDAEPIATHDLAAALSYLRGHADWIVVDGLRDFGDAALAVLDLADVVLLTFTQDVPALKNASRCVAVFRRLGYGPGKVRLVVNRYQKHGKLGLDAIADALKAPVDATIANDFPTVMAAINGGKLLADAAPRAHVTRDLEALVARVAGGGEP
jgi:pilus assembly protein CpaE